MCPLFEFLKRMEIPPVKPWHRHVMCGDWCVLWKGHFIYMNLPESLLNGFRAWPRLGSSIRNFKWVSHSKWIRHLLKKTFYVWISLGNYFIISFSEVGCTLVDGGSLLKIESVLCIRRYVYCKGGKKLQRIEELRLSRLRL